MPLVFTKLGREVGFPRGSIHRALGCYPSDGKKVPSRQERERRSIYP